MPIVKASTVRALVQVFRDTEEAGHYHIAHMVPWVQTVHATCAQRGLEYSADEFAEARRLVETGDELPVDTPPQPKFRSLDELDDLSPNDPKRDEISKRLSPEDQVKLMARYGYHWPVRT
jgi:hypothetical protein